MSTGPNLDTNADAAELARFAAIAHRWWDVNGPQAALHAINPVRLEYIAARVQLRGARLLDLGCGGGLLAEALAREGARVTGIDLAGELIDIARLHLMETRQSGASLDLDYRLQSAEALAQDEPGCFDAVVCMELLEHVPDPQSVLDACARLLKPGGLLLASTLNRTPAAFALAIVGAEYLTGLIEPGTHDWRKFIKPSEFAAGLRRAGLELEEISGLGFDPLRRRAWIGTNPEVNYLGVARKPA